MSMNEVVDFLADETPSIDFLADGVSECNGDYLCDPLQGGCGHGLTAHSRGMVIHDRCLIAGCGCQQAVLTEGARRKVKQGLLP